MSNNLNIKIFFVLLIAFLTANANEARITIRTAPDGLTIRIDSVTIGQSPILNFSLAPGIHRIEAITPQDGLWNAGNILQNIFLKSGQDTTILLRLPQPVTINSVPFHAKVRAGDQFVGFTPLEVDFNRWGKIPLTLEKEGYESQTVTLQQPRPLLLVLAPISGDEQKPQSLWDRQLFRKKTKRKVLLISGALVTHWLAFYLKNKADDNYDKYRQSTHPDRIQHYWDQTRKYDRYSDISLGISYSMLAGLIYTVITD